MHFCWGIILGSEHDTDPGRAKNGHSLGCVSNILLGLSHVCKQIKNSMPNKLTQHILTCLGIYAGISLSAGKVVPSVVSAPASRDMWQTGKPLYTSPP